MRLSFSLSWLVGWSVYWSVSLLYVLLLPSVVRVQILSQLVLFRRFILVAQDLSHSRSVSLVSFKSSEQDVCGEEEKEEPQLKLVV